MGQATNFRQLSELINTKESAWNNFIQQWIKDSKNFVEVLPKDPLKADSTLYKSQITTRSSMGSIIYETGGILIDHGWIRILGSGSKKLDRNLMDWNKGKTYKTLGEKLPYLLIADDILGGFFAINSGGLDAIGIGKVYYFAPDNLIWSSTEMTYTEFLSFCFSGDIKKFYTNLYWTGWEKEIDHINGNEGVYCFPYLCTTQGKDINKVTRSIVSIDELWISENELQRTMLIEYK
ncbi:MAG: DUF2625 domain-containing protein [Bacteroidetes bacterium]|nr:DUF2625 domain-containing protein [Bacteroidota bacterium]